MAGELGLDVYVVSMSRVGMDDTSLGEIIAELPGECSKQFAYRRSYLTYPLEKCIALMEDIDAAFSQTINRELDEVEDDAGDNKKDTKQKNPNAPPPQTTSRVTLSGLLNALDGVGAQEGRILFATTNKYTSLDPALCRPGRMDIHIEFKLASQCQARELYRCFYLPDPDNEVKTHAEKEKEKEDAQVNDDSDSGYSSASEKEKDSCPPSPSEVSPVSSPADTITFSGSSHRARAPKLSPRKVDSLADRFAAAIPEREFSMAALQGYLMAYKVRPFDAVKDAAAWVEKDRADRTKKPKAAPPADNSKSIQDADEAKPEEKVEDVQTPSTEVSS